MATLSLSDIVSVHGWWAGWKKREERRVKDRKLINFTDVGCTWGQQVIMSSSHKRPLCPPTLFLSHPQACPTCLTKPLLPALLQMLPLGLCTSLSRNLLLFSLNNLKSSWSAFHLLVWLPCTEKPSHPLHQLPRGPYGGVDRSEKERRDLVSLKILLDTIFTDAKHFYCWLFKSVYQTSWLIQKLQGGKLNDTLTFSNTCTHTHASTLIISTDAVRQFKRMQSQDFSAFTSLVPSEQMMVGSDGEERGRRMKGDQWEARRKWG